MDRTADRRLAARASSRQFDLQGAPPLLYVVKRVTHRSTKLPSAARLIAVIIADCINSQTNSGFMAISTIAKRASLHKRSVQRHLRSLCEGSDRVFERVLGRERNCYTFSLVRSLSHFPDITDGANNTGCSNATEAQ